MLQIARLSARDQAPHGGDEEPPVEYADFSRTLYTYTVRARQVSATLLTGGIVLGWITINQCLKKRTMSFVVSRVALSTAACSCGFALLILQTMRDCHDTWQSRQDPYFSDQQNRTGKASYAEVFLSAGSFVAGLMSNFV